MKHAIDTMIEEHDIILRFNQIIHNACLSILDGKEVYVNDFKDMVQFARNYADKHHHGKEEQILFKEMVNHLGSIGTKLIVNGMLVEHDLGRLLISELDKSLDVYVSNQQTSTKLDIIANAIGYTNLLKRHIDKENNVIFFYAQKNLLKHILDDIDAKSIEFENQATELGIQKKYFAMLIRLESKYL